MLTSDKLGSIDIGAPILYRQVRVGGVQSYQLSRDRQRVVVGVHIEPEYAHLVNTSTRLGLQRDHPDRQPQWRAGEERVATDPDHRRDFLRHPRKAPTVTKVRRFTLFDSEEAAMARGVEIQLSIDNADGLREGTPIRFRAWTSARSKASS